MLLYYSPEAVDENYTVFFDGIEFYRRIPVTGSLNGLDGRGFLKKVGKALKKVGKVTFKVIKKIVPIASAVSSFIPGVGWAVKAGLTAAEWAIKLADQRKQQKEKERYSNSQQPYRSNTSNKPQQITNRTALVSTQKYNELSNIQNGSSKNESFLKLLATIQTTLTPDISKIIQKQKENQVSEDYIRNQVKTQLKINQPVLSEVLNLIF